MAEIHKKIWPKWFELIKEGKKNVEYRLADFKIKPGDILILEEYDPKKKKYTGRTIKRKVKFVHKVNPFEYYKYKELKEYGHYLIELK